MGYVKEPDGVDFVVDPTPLTIADRKKISEVIAHYKATGQKLATIKGVESVKRAATKKKVAH